MVLKASVKNNMDLPAHLPTHAGNVCLHIRSEIIGSLANHEQEQGGIYLGGLDTIRISYHGHTCDRSSIQTSTYNHEK